MPEVYQKLGAGKVEAFSWPGMRTALYAALARGLAERVAADPPMWPVYDAHRAFGQLGASQAHGWRSLAWMALATGYYAVAEVDFHQRGPGQVPDHDVLVCGIREQGPPPGQAGIIHTEVLISCSARHPEGAWVEDTTFLERWGGFNALWAKPR